MGAERVLADEGEMAAYAATLAARLQAGDVFLLSGPLGAGKTTLVRGVLRALGWQEPVRSPTFNLIATYPTTPPLMHADLYRLESAVGLGLEEYVDSHACFIEWPDRLGGFLDRHDRLTRIEIAFDDAGRRLRTTG